DGSGRSGGRAVGVVVVAATLPGVAGAGAAQGVRAPGERAVRDEVVRRTVRDDGGDHVAGARHVRRPLREGDVDEPVVRRAAAHAGGGAVLAAAAVADEDLDRAADLPLVLARADPLL